MSVRAFTTILWTLLSLLIGCSSQVVQQQYFPRGRFFGREWTFVSRTQPLDGQPAGILVTRTREGILAYDQNQQIIGDPNGIPASITDESPQPSIAEYGNPAPQSRVMDPASSADDGLSGAVESQTGPEMGNPVEVDAEEANYSYNNNRNKRDYSSWKIFNGLSPSKFFSDRRTPDNKATKESRYPRAKKSAYRSPSVGITKRLIPPVEEDVNEPRYRRGTDDNLTRRHYYYRSARDAETNKRKIRALFRPGGGSGDRRRGTTTTLQPTL